MAQPLGLARVHSRAQHGIEAQSVTIEAHLGSGLPAFALVGLPETAVREARDRVKSAIQTAGIQFPDARITVNLAPADLPKEGGRFDLGIALAILAAAGVLPARHLERIEVLGELGLSGNVRPTSGTLSSAIAAAQAGRDLMVAAANHPEAALLGDGVLAVAHLNEALAALCKPELALSDPPHRREGPTTSPGATPALSDVRGQHAAKRALVIAATGGHHLLLRGPPGAGKTMLAHRLPALLPPLSSDQARDVVRVHSAWGEVDVASLISKRPFREPHHSASRAALVGGGGRIPRPGEIALAHHGVLFLDELPEFDRRVLEALRQPLEGRGVTIARATARIHYPAEFQLVAAMNPCPAGRTCRREDCQCGAEQRRRHHAKLSGPLLDRIDLQVTVPAVPASELLSRAGPVDDETALRETIQAARTCQLNRSGRLNRDLGATHVNSICALHRSDRRLLADAADKLELSARGCHRVLKVARSIADLDGEDAIATLHLTEALSYRIPLQLS